MALASGTVPLFRGAHGWEEIDGFGHVNFTGIASSRRPDRSILMLVVRVSCPGRSLMLPQGEGKRRRHIRLERICQVELLVLARARHAATCKGICLINERDE